MFPLKHQNIAWFVKFLIWNCLLLEKIVSERRETWTNDSVMLSQFIKNRSNM